MMSLLEIVVFVGSLYLDQGQHTVGLMKSLCKR